MNMRTLEENVINVWGDQGKSWLNQLPDIILQLTQHWGLSDITAVENMSYNYVAKALQNNHTPVVLKISCDKRLIHDEYKALCHFNGHGSIKVIDQHQPLNALLLKQAIPGYLLKDNHPDEIQATINIYADVVNATASQTKPTSQYTHVRQWCQAIDRISDDRIKKHFIHKAKALSSFLLKSVENEYLCHGDLHLENIIQHGNKWLSIDPKGIIGEVAFEAAAFDLIDKNEWAEPESIQDKILNRTAILASNLNINKDRLLAWIFLRVVISAQWFIEDNGKPDEILKLASFIYPLISDDFQASIITGEHHDH